MVNQQKQVQQDTAYSAVVVNDPRPRLYHFVHVSMTPFGSKIGMGIHMIIHYNCTIRSLLLQLFLLIYHPSPLHFLMFTLVPLIFLSSFIIPMPFYGIFNCPQVTYNPQCWFDIDPDLHYCFGLHLYLSEHL